MNKQVAKGHFEVKLGPEPLSQAAGESGLGRMSLDKHFSGDLQATSHGEMLAFRSSVTGSAGYVAMEKVSGVLSGRKGTFVLQHSSTMTRGVPHQAIQVVPDSGSDALLGLQGNMQIIITDGQHGYEFEYSLSDA